MKKIKSYFSLFIIVVIISSFANLNVCASETTPFKDLVIPGTVNFCDFDNGGQGISYGKIYERNGTYNYRDAFINFYASSFGAIVGTNVGGWYVYTLNVTEDGLYSIGISGGCLTKCIARLTFDKTMTMECEYEPSGAWTSPLETVVAEIELTKGKHTLMFEQLSGGANLYYMNFRYQGKKSEYEYAKKVRPYRNYYAPCIIKAEEYDIGTCVSNDNENNLKKFRKTEPMDIGQHDDHYYLLCNKGESVIYTVNVTKADTYKISADICADSQFSIEIDDVKIASYIDAKFNEHESYVDLVNVDLKKGKHKIKFLCESTSYCVSNFKVVATDEELTKVVESEESSNNEENNYSIYKEYYVSNNGDDSFSGDIENPFKTIQRAIDEIPKINKTMTGDIIIHVDSGDYFIDEPITVDEKASGLNGYNVILKGDDSLNSPVINGGTKITGWKKSNNSPIYVADADIENTRSLYINGYPATLAKSKYNYRASSEYNIEDSEYPIDGLVVSKTNFPKSFKHPEDLMLGWNLLWTCQRTPVESIVYDDLSATLIMKQPYFRNYAKIGYSGTCTAASQKFFLENAIELLDEPGEFYFDKHEKKIYYYPYENEDLDIAETYVATTNGLMYVIGSDINHKIDNFCVDNISFKYGAYDDVEKMGVRFFQTDCYYLPNEKGDWYTQKMFPAQFELKNADGVIIKNCHFSSLGSNALNMTNGVINTKVLGNSFCDIAGTAIVVDDVNHTQILPDGMQRCENIEVSNNVIRRSAYEYLGLCAISIYYGKNINCNHNDIKDVPYTAITVGWGWGGSGNVADCHDIFVTHNRIENVMKTVHDGGHIYTLGRMENTHLSNNYLINSCDNRGGIYLDQGSQCITIENNVGKDNYQWLFARGGADLKEVKVDHNFSDNSNYTQDKANVTYTNATVVTDGNWPQEAIDIMNNAGVTDEYKYLLNGVEYPEYRLQPIQTHPLKEFETAAKYNKWQLGRDYTDFFEITGDKPDVYVGGEIGSTHPGEWVEFTFDAYQTDDYYLTIRGGDGWTADAPICTAKLTLDGVTIADDIVIPRDNWKLINIDIGKFHIEQGTHKFRMYVQGNDWLIGGFLFDNKKAIPDDVNYDESEIVSETDFVKEYIGFTDIKDHWAKFYIEYLSEKEIVNGYDKNTFAPEDSLTIEQASLLTLRCTDKFNEDKWYEKALEYELFDANENIKQPVTRERFADILMKIYSKKHNSYKITIGTSIYNDFDSVSDKYIHAVMGAKEYGFMKGFEDNTFRPTEYLTRAQATVVIYNLLYNS